MASPSQLASSVPGPGVLFCVGMSVALHLGPLAAGAVIVPPPCAGEETEYDLTMAQREELSRLLATADEKEIERREAELAPGGDGDGAGSGTRTRCEEGMMGNPRASGWHDRLVERPDPSPEAVRAAALRDASEFAVTTLRGGHIDWAAAWYTDDEPADGPFFPGPFPRVDSRGQGPDPSFPLPRLSGVGDDDRDARGAEHGLGLGSLGVLGAAAHSAPRRDPGRAPFFGSVRLRPPQVRFGAMSISGRLPAEVVQHVLRRHLGRLRGCYENGLRDNPVLQGRVAARLVIGVDGAVSSVGNAGSDLPDSGVVSCVARTYRGMRFPQPEGGVVTAVVPLRLSPD